MMSLLHPDLIQVDEDHSFNTLPANTNQPPPKFKSFITNVLQAIS